MRSRLQFNIAVYVSVECTHFEHLCGSGIRLSQNCVTHRLAVNYTVCPVLLELSMPGK